MDFNTVCRTCLKKTTLLKPIFPIPHVHKRFSNVMFHITGVRIIIKDGLPQKICTECLKKVNDTIKFRAKCKESEETLLEIKNFTEQIDKKDIKIQNISKTLETEVLDIKQEIIYGNDESNSQSDNAMCDDDDQPLKYLIVRDIAIVNSIEETDPNEESTPHVKVEPDSHNMAFKHLEDEIEQSNSNFTHNNQESSVSAEYKHLNSEKYIPQTNNDITEESICINFNDPITPTEECKAVNNEKVSKDSESAAEICTLGSSNKGKKRKSKTKVTKDVTDVPSKKKRATDDNSNSETRRSSRLRPALESDHLSKLIEGSKDGRSKVMCLLCLKSLKLLETWKHLLFCHPEVDPRKFCKPIFETQVLPVEHVTSPERVKRKRKASNGKKNQFTKEGHIAEKSD